MCPTCTVEPKQRDLDLFSRRINIQDSPGHPDATVEVPGLRVVVHRAFDDLQERGMEPISIRTRPLLILEVKCESARYVST